MKVMSRLKQLFHDSALNREYLNQLRFNQGLVLREFTSNASCLEEAEFQVFSQWGEDGILQFLVRKVGIEIQPSFIEFGVETFTEANCRFLLMTKLWRGLVIDGSEKNIEFIRNDTISWRYGLRSRHSFITAENINSIFKEEGFSGRVGVLSIDIDGNDYWVLKAINCVEADILVLEYNSIFGPERSVTVPYDPMFRRNEKHYSNLYWGASLQALTSLAKEKGYFLVGCNSQGNNAFYLNNRHTGKIPPLPVEKAFRAACFMESRNPDGSLSFLTLKEGVELIKDLKLVEINSKS
jgi:hypothetical protein